MSLTDEASLDAIGLNLKNQMRSVMEQKGYDSGL